MSYNAGWEVSHPGYDRVTGCIEWPDREWDAFAERLALPADRHGYFYVRDSATGAFVGHAHYAVEPDGAAHIGLNVVPASRGCGLGALILRLLVERVWRDTAAEEIVNEFEDRRGPPPAHTAVAGSCPIPRPAPTGDAPPGPGGSGGRSPRPRTGPGQGSPRPHRSADPARPQLARWRHARAPRRPCGAVIGSV